jgi:hypothetical protein
MSAKPTFANGLAAVMGAATLLCLSAGCGTLTRSAAPTALTVKSNFPGGSIIVEMLDAENQLIRFTPASNPGRGWDCWWYFKVEGIRPGTIVTLDLSGMNFATPDQAQFSLDNKTWTQTAPGTRTRERIVYQQRIDATEAWFAWGPPFQLSHARKMVRRVARSSPHAKAFTLCRSLDGHPVPALRITERGSEEAPEFERAGVWVHARQHAWETGSSWVCRGFTEWLVSNEPEAVALRKRAVIYIVPIMDADNVERGAGGKNQDPHDHNRDWSDAPRYPEVRAAMERIRRMDEAGNFRLFVDLHNPAPRDRNVHFHITPRELVPEKGPMFDRFIDLAREEMTRSDLKFMGKIVQSGRNYDGKWERISGVWTTRNTRDRAMGICVETAWNTPHSTQAGYLQVGRELGRTVARYLANE